VRARSCRSARSSSGRERSRPTRSPSFVYTGADGAFTLYEDDGLTYGYEKGASARIPIRWNDATGTLTGTFAHDLVVTIHPDGSLNFRGKGTFTGTVDGVSGSFEDTLEGQGSVVSGELRGTITILKGFGHLAGLQGRVTIEGIPATGGTYVVEFQL